MKRIFSIVGFATGTFALILQLYLVIAKALELNQSILSEVWRFLSYMTIWSNILVTLCFASLLFANKLSFFKKPAVQAGTFIYIFVVGVAYHFLLARIWAPQGWQYLADVLLHYGVPILYCLFWLVFADKAKLSYSNAFSWLWYPFIYFIYSLLRGLITETYSYPFVDVNELGYPMVLFNSFLLLIVYVLLGFGTILLSRKFAKA